VPGDLTRPAPRSVRRLQVAGNTSRFGCNTHVHLHLSRLKRAGLMLPCSVCIRDAKEAFSVRPRFTDNFQYMVLDVQDNEEQNLIRLFPSYVYFLSLLCVYFDMRLQRQSQKVHRRCDWVRGYRTRPLQWYATCVKIHPRHLHTNSYCPFLQAASVYHPPLS